MNHHIYIIDQYPLQVLFTFMMIWVFITFLFYLLFNKIRDGPYLRLITCFADNKKICNSFIYFSQVKRNDVFTFFLLYSVDDGFNEFEFFVNRTVLFFFRVANTDNCSNNFLLRFEVLFTDSPVTCYSLFVVIFTSNK